MNGTQHEGVVRGPHSSYLVSDDRVLTGASLGNGSAWIICKATGALQKMFSLAIGRDVFWATTITYGSPLHRVLVGFEPSERVSEERLGIAGGHVTLAQVTAGKFEFHRGFQRHDFLLPAGLHVIETVFLPRTGFDDPAVGYMVAEIRNEGELERELVVHAYAKLRGTTPSDVIARYDSDLGALVAWNESQPNWVRFFGCMTQPDRYQTTHHAEESYDPANVPPLANTTDERGNLVGELSVRLAIAPGKAQKVAFILAFCERGEAEALKMYRAAGDVDEQLTRTIRFYADTVCQSQVLTPERTINDGTVWAKTNMLRVMAAYPQGAAFTNDPGASSNVVGRDLTWFTSGCDYLCPQMSREMLLRYARTQYDSGLMPEYYDAVSGEVNDYGLNINDNTPLFILACVHHYRITGDEDFLSAVWSRLCRAADYVCEQRDGRGLVVCTATGENVYGICGWRNVIPHYTLNGAVTEINAECFAALRRLSELAAMQSRRQTDRAADLAAAAAKYGSAAELLRQAMNSHLVNANNGMYVLNIGLDGDVHADVTGDEVFPVMFDAAPPAVGYRIISRLANADFQTEAGLRTVSRLSPDYTPYRDSGLIGGVWPGLSFWYAFAAAKIYPDAMVQNLKRGYEQYLRDPKIYNTVPGQFSEWFDGESLVNRGQRLSPWEPPRYVWAAIEGACGLNINEGPESFAVAPLMPSGWSWLGVRRLPLAGKELTYFVARHATRFAVFATGRVQVEGELEVFDEDVSDGIERLDPDMETIALRRGGELLLCLGSTSPVAFTFPISLKDLVDRRKRYTAHIYDSTMGRWVTGETAPGKDFMHLAMRIEAQGHGLIRLVPTGS